MKSWAELRNQYKKEETASHKSGKVVIILSVITRILLPVIGHNILADMVRQGNILPLILVFGTQGSFIAFYSFEIVRSGFCGFDFREGLL